MSGISRLNGSVDPFQKTNEAVSLPLDSGLDLLTYDVPLGTWSTAQNGGEPPCECGSDPEPAVYCVKEPEAAPGCGFCVLSVFTAETC